MAVIRGPHVYRFDPSQPRDEGGRWTAEGGSGQLVSKGKGDWRLPNGKKPDQKTLDRIKALRIPPGWQAVEINPDENATLQAVGVDAKGRDQYRYSAEHSEQAAAEKFARLKDFHEALPDIRDRIAKDLANETLSPTDREAAAVLALIDRTGFRIGGDGETLAEKQAYGAATLLAEHVSIRGDEITFNFTGKKGVDITKQIRDPEMAAILKPRVRTGGKLFNVTPGQVRDYLHSRDGEFKVKDFRTWHGTNAALELIKSMPSPQTERQFVQARREVAVHVANYLGNTPAVALNSYIDPAVWGKWQKVATWGAKRTKRLAQEYVWEEEKHPRDEDGKFTDGDGTTTSETALPEQDLKLIEAYTGTGGHSSVQDALREGKTLEGEVKATVEALDRLVRERGEPAPATTWRGLAGYEPEELGLEEGAEFTDPGFISTTRDRKTAMKFALAGNDKLEGEAVAMLFKIQSPKGVKAVDMDRYARYGESETMFARGTKFQVVSVQEGYPGEKAAVVTLKVKQ